MRKHPHTRIQGRQRVTQRDPDTGRTYVTGVTRSGRLIDKNRSDGWRGYRTHLTLRQRRLIRWALRQRQRGFPREKVLTRVLEFGWETSPMQYPISHGTIAAWELTRAAELKKGRDWPSLDED